MIKLTKATIKKYRCIETEQSFDVEDDITILVGINESGKTSILEALAKVNYFENDVDFEFDFDKDYPRKQKKAADKISDDHEAVTLTYKLSDEFIGKIETDIGVKVTIPNNEISITKKYSGNRTFSGVKSISIVEFLEKKLSSLTENKSDIISLLSSAKDTVTFTSHFNTIKTTYPATNLELINQLSKYFENKWAWDNPIGRICKSHNN